MRKYVMRSEIPTEKELERVIDDGSKQVVIALFKKARKEPWIMFIHLSTTSWNRPQSRLCLTRSNNERLVDEVF